MLSNKSPNNSAQTPSHGFSWGRGLNHLGVLALFCAVVIGPELSRGAFAASGLCPRKHAKATNPTIPIGTVGNLSLSTRLVRPFKGDDLHRSVIVYTPAGYGDLANASRHYLVVYLLHGAPGQPKNFLDKGRFPEHIEQAVQAGMLPPVILVMPDGNYRDERHGDGAWANSADGRDLFETWIVKEVIPYVDAHYHTVPEPSGRFLAGVSEGGLGAVNLTLRNPNIFGGAIGLSGYYDMRHFGGGHTIMGDNETLMAANSPLVYVPVQSLSSPDAWKGLKVYLGAGVSERPYADHSRQLGMALHGAGVRAVTVETVRGRHNWKLWGDLFIHALWSLLRSDPKQVAAAPLSNERSKKQ